MCCSYTKNPTHSPQEAVGAPLVSGGPWVTAGTGGNSEQAYSRWQRSALDPGPGVRVTKLFHFHLFTAGSPQHPFRLEDFFFFCQLNIAKAEWLIAYSRDQCSSTSSKWVLCISETLCNPSMETGTLTFCLPARALLGVTAWGREKVSRGWGSQQPHIAPNSSHSSHFHM